jgi:DNA-binding NarL/FixJ family response regulator
VNVEQLTATEARVAGLVAAGRDDREISDQLALGTGGCERHLFEVYRKLGIHSRMELTLLLRADAASPGSEQETR